MAHLDLGAQRTRIVIIDDDERCAVAERAQHVENALVTFERSDRSYIYEGRGARFHSRHF